MEKYDVVKQEAYDFKLLQKLNEDVFHLNNLERRESNTDKDPIDASGMTEDGRTINIEIKYRNSIYPRMMCETHKAFSLLDEWAYHERVPLYVNFVNNGKDVYVWNLLHIPPNMKHISREEKTKSKLYGDKESGYKLYFSLKAAKHYALNENNQYELKKGN